MGASFFSFRSPGHTGEAGAHVGRAEVGLDGLERQQALLVGALRRAAGRPMSYAALRDAGIEFPAAGLESRPDGRRLPPRKE